jgi:thioredoxin-related protein
MNISRGLRFFLAALAATVFLAQAPAPQAAELVMFEQKFCEWCEAWHTEIGAVYSLTDEGKLLPLRQVDIDEDRPEDLKKYGPILFTPTFIVIDNGREVGRILGYPGEVIFYWLLNEIIGKLGRAESAKIQAGLAVEFAN